MSGVSTLIDKIDEKLNLILPEADGYFQLDNPFEAEMNDALILCRGFGFFIGPKSVIPKMGEHEAFEASLIITQTIIDRGLIKGKTLRMDAHKALHEDQYKVISWFRKNKVADKIWDVAFQSDNGTEFVFVQKQNYVMLKTTFRVKFSEGC